MSTERAPEKLRCLAHMLQEELASGDPILVATHNLLASMRDSIGYNTYIKEKELSELYIEVANHDDGSIGAVPKYFGAFYLVRNNELLLEDFVPCKKSQSAIEATLDTIYKTLTDIFALHNTLNTPLVIYTSNFKVIDLLNKVEDLVMLGDLKRAEDKRDHLVELIKALPVPITIEWRARGSTRGMKRVKYLVEP